MATLYISKMCCVVLCCVVLCFVLLCCVCIWLSSILVTHKMLVCRLPFILPHQILPIHRGISCGTSKPIIVSILGPASSAMASALWRIFLCLLCTSPTNSTAFFGATSRTSSTCVCIDWGSYRELSVGMFAIAVLPIVCAPTTCKPSSRCAP